MNRKILALAMALCLSCVATSFVVTGCGSTPQKVAYNTIYSLEVTATAAYDGYVGEVIRGRVSTNGLPSVSKKYNQFQAASLVALDAAQFNTNALAPANLVILSQDLLNLIATFNKK